MILKLGIIVLIIGFYIILYSLREKYLSGFQFNNLSTVIFYIGIILLILYEEILLNVFTIPSEIQRSVSIIIIIATVLLLTICIYFNNKFEKEKLIRSEEWNKWIGIKKEINIYRKFFLYYGVKRNINWGKDINNKIYWKIIRPTRGCRRLGQGSASERWNAVL